MEKQGKRIAIYPSIGTRMAGVIMVILFVFLGAVMFTGSGVFRYLTLPLIVYGIFYFISPLFNCISIDSKLRLKSISIDVEVGKNDVGEWGIFRTYDGAKLGGFVNRKMFLINLKNGECIIYPLSGNFSNIKQKVLLDNFEVILSSKPKDYGFMGYKEGISKFGLRFLFLDSYKL